MSSQVFQALCSIPFLSQSFRLAASSTSMTEKWERQWRTVWVSKPASKAKTEQWVRVPGYQEFLGVAPTYSDQHHRSMPSLPLPDRAASLESPDATFYWWDELSQEQIFQAATTDPLGSYQSLLAKHVTSPTTPFASSTWHSAFPLAKPTEHR